jgi:hypothetical protein
MKPQPEVVMTIQATANEVIAMNALITQYLRAGQGDTDMQRLLQQFQLRLVASLPERPGLPPEQSKNENKRVRQQ